MNAEEKAVMQEIINTGAQTVKDLRVRCEELTKANVDAGALHLADEQSVRNIRAEMGRLKSGWDDELKVRNIAIDALKESERQVEVWRPVIEAAKKSRGDKKWPYVDLSYLTGALNTLEKQSAKGAVTGQCASEHNGECDVHRMCKKGVAFEIEFARKSPEGKLKDALLQMRELKRIFVKDSCDCGPWQDEELQRHKAGCQYRMYVEDIEKQHPISEGVIIRQGEDGAECAKCGEQDYPLVNHKCRAQCPKCGIVGREDRCLSCNAEMKSDSRKPCIAGDDPCSLGPDHAGKCVPHEVRTPDDIEEFVQGVQEHSSSTPCMDCGRPVLPGRSCGAC